MDDRRTHQRVCQRLEGFSEQTAWAVQDFKAYSSPHFIVRLQDERDGVLAEYALAALEKAYEVLGGDLGQRPSSPVRIEIFPITNDFTPPPPFRNATSKWPGPGYLQV